MRPHLKLSHKGLLLVAIPFIFEVAFIVGLYHILERSEIEASRANHCKAIASETNKLVTDLYEGINTLVTYHQKIEPGVAQHYTDVVVEIPNRLRALKQLTADDSYQIRTLQSIEPDLAKVLSFMTMLKVHIQNEDPIMAIEKVSQWNLLIRWPFTRLMTRLKELTDYQDKNLSVDPAEEARLRGLFKLILGLGILGNVIIAGLVWKLITGITRRVEVLTENTLLLSSEKELLPPQKGNDELSRLDMFFHDMAEALHDASKKERAFVENAIDVIFSLDRTGRFTKVSKACKRAWGYDDDELLGRQFEEIVTAEDRQAASQYINRMIAGQAPEPLEAHILRKDKERLYVLFSAQWVQSEQSLFCVAHDISTRKQEEDLLKASEAKIRSIIESTLVGLTIVDEQGSIQSINRRMEWLFGYKEADLAGKNINLLLASEELASSPIFPTELLAKILNKTYETEARTRSGQHLPVEIMASRLGSEDDHRYLLNFLDISERHEVERLKQEFVAMVSHDLRTPLTSVLSSLTLLGSGAFGPLTEKGVTKVQNSESELMRLIQLINDLLDIARMEAGRMEFYFEKTQINTIIENAINAVATLAENKEIEIVSSGTDCRLAADADRLVQVLVNLLSNAIKFSPANTQVSIRVNTDAGWTLVTVSDQGRGVPEALRDSIFDRFRQVQKSDAQSNKGSGLGLAICKTIVQGHGGTIGVKSQEGSGSSFWFRIPNNLPARAASSSVLPLALPPNF